MLYSSARKLSFRIDTKKGVCVDAIARLAKSTDGLLFSSEADYPLEPFLWTNPQPFVANLLYTLTTLPESTAVTEIPLKEFFAPMVSLDPDASAEAQTRVARYKKLIRLLRRILSDLTVYKLGTIEIPTFIVGRLADGTIAGLRTTVVET
jgi:hypothetical protein